MGRDAELAALEQLIIGESKRLAYVHGMGGIGKTELVRHFAGIARQRGWAVTWLDARDLAPVAEALAPLLPRGGDGELSRLIVIDSFELLAAAERPLRERLFPALPSSTRIVLAGRMDLDAAWRTDPGWSGWLDIIELGELSWDEAGEYLKRRQVAADRVDEVLDLAGGVPLALALACDVIAGVDRGELDRDPDLIDLVLERVMETAPSAIHRRALMASAVLLHTTEELLESVSGSDEPFRWLASRPFFQWGDHGIFPHDVVRRALIRRLQWRRPARFRQLLVAAGEALTRQLRQEVMTTRTAETIRGLHFLFALSQVGPMVADALYRVKSTDVRADDWPLIDQLLAEQAGPDAVELLRRWRHHPALEILAVRRGGGPFEGFVAGLSLDALGPGEIARLPGPDRFAAHFGHPDHPTPYVWLWADRRSGQAISVTQTVAMEWLRDQLLSRRGCRRSALALHEDQTWMYTGTTRNAPTVVPECGFELGGRRFALLVKDHDEPARWFLAMTEEWLEMLVGAASPPDSQPAPTPPIGEILDSLKAALKHADRPDLLGDSRLFGLAIVQELAGGDSAIERGRALAEFLRELADELLASPRDHVNREILERTYFDPGDKQRAIAADLGLSFSTYRRYLVQTLERLAALLLEREQTARAMVID